jgi:hypothetical protein
MELKREPRSGIKVMSAFGPKRTFVSIAVRQLVDQSSPLHQMADQQCKHAG